MTSFQSSIIVIIKHKFQEKKKLTKNRFLILLSILFFLILLQHDAEIVLPSYFHFRRASFFNFHLVPNFRQYLPGANSLTLLLPFKVLRPYERNFRKTSWMRIATSIRNFSAEARPWWPSFSARGHPLRSWHALIFHFCDSTVARGWELDKTRRQCGQRRGITFRLN